MRHLHIPFVPGRHQSGLLFILVLILLTDIGDVGDHLGCPRTQVQNALNAATGLYFTVHPHYRRGDHNCRMVRNLVKKHLGDEQNSMELLCLIIAMENEPLYQWYLIKIGRRITPPNPSRKRIFSRSVSPTGVPWKMPKGTVRFEVPGPRSVASSSGPTVRFEVPGPESAATSSSDSPESAEAYLWELDKHEWVIRNCWACPECNSMNLRNALWCHCGMERFLLRERRPGDRDCPWCGTWLVAWRRYCPVPDCPSRDWKCPKRGNPNWCRRQVCNRSSCHHPHPWYGLGPRAC